LAEYLEALKRPFTDIKKLIIGMIIGIIPIINFMFSGYLLKVAKSTMNRQRELPEWSGWSDLFVKGVLAYIIGIVYMIPVAIIALIAVFTGLLTLPTITDLAPLKIITWLFGAGVAAIILVIISVIFALLSSVAILSFADTEKFGSAFEFGDIARKAFNGQYIGGWLITMIISLVIGFLLSWIPFVGIIIAMYMLSVFIYTSLAQIYNEL
jgi:hypothetical protein